MVEVIINGTSIDLISKGIKYTKQVNDFADISTVNTSYTYSIEADKTPKNTQLFEQLGMVGDTSRTPYVKNNTQLIDNGAVLIEKGLSTVKETNDGYKLFIQDGIIEIFKLIENKYLGIHLDLNELQHQKTAQTIIDSWNGNTPYRYLIADYNGKTNEGNVIDVQYQIPSINVKYLWDRMFEYLGYTYSGNFDFIADKWMTYPKPPEVEENNTSVSFFGVKQNYSGGWNDNYKEWDSYSPEPLTDFTLLTNNNKKWRAKVNFTGSYQITLSALGSVFVDFESLFVENVREIFKVNLLIDGEFIDSVLSNGESKTLTPIIQADSIIELEIVAADLMEVEMGYNSQRQFYERGDYQLKDLEIDNLSFLIVSKGKEEINFQNALSDFSIKDFFKEIMIRGGLTPFPDNINKHIKFKNLKERFSTEAKNVHDLSSKYLKRTNEKYTFGTYAQKNILRLKYNNEEDNYNDGFVFVENKNIDDEKPLFNSKLYSPEQRTSTISISASTEEVPLIKLWEKEIKEVDEGQEIQYKPLNNRFYLLTSQWNDEFININNLSNTGFYTASLHDTTMREVANTKYDLVYKIFTDTRIHDFDLILTAYDFQSLPLDKLHYVEQEGQFYILNKVIWETGKIAKGEFLRVKKI